MTDSTGPADPNVSTDPSEPYGRSESSGAPLPPRALDLRSLPKVRDSWTYLYVEHARIDQDGKAIAIHDVEGKTPVPCAALTLLLLGPGTTISHAAVRTLADNGCLIAWSGEEAVRYYASGGGETRSARGILHQARLWADPARRLQVVERMYRRRFPEALPPGMTLQQLRGREGVRVREAYARASRASGVPWHGRSYARDDWRAADPVNRALSCANSCLYGVCHGAIVAAGFSPAIGFVHTGKMLSFVYDVADLYKADLTIPAAFAAVAEGTEELEGRVRRGLRDTFHRGRLLGRIVADVQAILALDPDDPEGGAYDADAGLPGGLWDPEAGTLSGGVNWGVAGSDADPGSGSDAGPDALANAGDGGDDEGSER